MIKIILVVAAIIAFVIAAVGGNIPHVALIPTGLALWAGSTLVGGSPK